MSESTTVDEDVDIAEWLRLAILWALILANGYMIYDAVKDRPDIIVLRQRIRSALLGPLEKARRLRRAERQVVFEAMETVAEKESHDGN